MFILDAGQWLRVDVLYRFFELFDLKNIPKSELMMYAAKKGQVVTTPPYKTCLEEKLSFALFHHPSLKPNWEKTLGSETFDTLSHLIPETWILDSRSMPPYGVIPGLELKGSPVQDWQELMGLTQKEREMVIKPSGFSPESWGSRGVVVGHDVSGEVWQETLTKGLQSFPDQTSILQKFYKGKTSTGFLSGPKLGQDGNDAEPGAADTLLFCGGKHHPSGGHSGDTLSTG